MTLYGPYLEIIFMTWNLWIISRLVRLLVIQSCIIWLAWGSWSLLMYSFLPLTSCDLQENRKLKQIQYRFKCPHKGSHILFTIVNKMRFVSTHAQLFCPKIIPKNSFQVHSPFAWNNLTPTGRNDSKELHNIKRYFSDPYRGYLHIMSFW
jgi:hypothetical protein